MAFLNLQPMMEYVIHFSQPHWILIGLLLCLGVIFFWHKSEKQRQIQMEGFAAAHLLGRLTRNISSRRRLLKKGLLLLALFCCFLALARPQYGFKWVEVKRKGIDILLALDTSKSMLTADIRPNRLERSKLAIMDFVNQLDGDRVGLLPFAGSAFLMCPLTIDYNAFEDSLAMVNTDIIPRGGTDLAKAITLAESSLMNNANHKILILLTDGENLEGDALAAAAKAAGNGMTIFTVGVGTTKGELIPVSSSEPGNFIRDESGKFITSRLDEAVLTAIAKAAGGIYVPLGKNGEGLERIYQQKLSLIPKKELSEKKHQEPLERSGWPLGAAIVLLMVEFMISGRKSDRSFRLPFIITAGRRSPKASSERQSSVHVRRKDMSRKAAALFLLITLTAVNCTYASKGEKAFAAGDFLAASKFYTEALKEKPDDPTLHYNAGTAAYKNNLFDDAIASFQQALKSADLGLQEKTYYNLGNALFRKGEELAQSDPGPAEKLWQQALDAYDGSLQLNPQSKDSKENQELVKKKLEELKQQQQQKNDQQKQEQQQQQTGGQQEQQENQGQSEKQGEQAQKQGNDSGAQDGLSSPEKKSGDDSNDSKEQSGDKSADKEQQPEQGAEAGSGDEPQQKDAAAVPQAAEPGQDDQRRPETNVPLTSGQDEERRQSGKMTSEEARQLLQRLKDEEGKLNFVPQEENEEAGKERSWKDW